MLLCNTSIIMCTSTFYFDLMNDFFEKVEQPYLYYTALLLIAPPFACIPLAGWLADAKLGNYKTFRAGSVLLFLSVTVGTITSLVTHYVLVPQVVPTVIQIISGSFGIVGTGTCLITALQLGLDQMPDASADNITSFIAWFVCSIFLGVWLSCRLTDAVLTCGK